MSLNAGKHMRRPILLALTLFLVSSMHSNAGGLVKDGLRALVDHHRGQIKGGGCRRDFAEAEGKGASKIREMLDASRTVVEKMLSA